MFLKEFLILALAALTPWIGLIVLVVIMSHMDARLSALEEKMTALTGELGWKEN